MAIDSGVGHLLIGGHKRMILKFDAPDSYCLSEFAFDLSQAHRFVVFDLEATGADHLTDSVTQVGAVAVYADGPHDDETFTSLVLPARPIPPKIEALTGVTNEMVSSAPEFSEVFPRFARFCDGSALVTQCGYEFDFPLMDRECECAGYAKLGSDRLDTKAVFALMHREKHEIFSTDYLSEYYGIDRALFRRHDALGDARLISRFFHAQLREARFGQRARLSAEVPIRIKRFVLPPL